MKKFLLIVLSAASFATVFPTPAQAWDHHRRSYRSYDYCERPVYRRAYSTYSYDDDYYYSRPVRRVYYSDNYYSPRYYRSSPRIGLSFFLP
jgi:hypothetical protein